MDIKGEIITNAQRSTKPPARWRDAPIEDADVTIDVLRKFAADQHLTIAWVVQRFMEISPDLLDEDKAIILQREQAKLGVEVMKAASTKEINHAGDVNLQVTSIERRIIDA